MVAYVVAWKEGRVKYEVRPLAGQGLRGDADSDHTDVSNNERSWKLSPLGVNMSVRPD